MKIYPLRDNLIIKQIKKEEKSQSGIIVEIAEALENKGIVLRVGKDVNEIEEGDEVLFGNYAGSGIKDADGQDFLIVKEEEIFAIVKEGK